jgi:hypothetical protein
MRLVFDNAIVWNRLETPIGSIAAYLKKKFEKRLQLVRCGNVRNFEGRLFQLLRDMDTLLGAPPRELRLAPIHVANIGLLEDFTSSRITALLARLNGLVCEGRMSDILAVLKDSGDPIKLEEKMEIDLAGISRKSLNGLERFVSEAR